MHPDSSPTPHGPAVQNLPAPPSEAHKDQDGTDLAAWQVEMAALQESYAEKRAAWRNSVVGPVLPPEKRKKGRPS